MNVKIVTLIVTFALGFVLACVSSEAQQSAKSSVGYVTVTDDLSLPRRTFRHSSGIAGSRLY